MRCTYACIDIFMYCFQTPLSVIKYIVDRQCVKFKLMISMTSRLE